MIEFFSAILLPLSGMKVRVVCAGTVKEQWVLKIWQRVAQTSDDNDGEWQAFDHSADLSSARTIAFYICSQMALSGWDAAGQDWLNSHLTPRDHNTLAENRMVEYAYRNRK